MNLRSKYIPTYYISKLKQIPYRVRQNTHSFTHNGHFSFVIHLKHSLKYLFSSCVCDLNLGSPIRSYLLTGTDR